MGKILPSGVTQGELDQAQRLIYRGKTFAAAGDPRMQRIIKYLEESGFQSAQQQVQQRQLEREMIKREAWSIGTRVEKGGSPIIPGEVTPDYTSPTIQAGRLPSKITPGTVPSDVVGITEAGRFTFITGKTTAPSDVIGGVIPPQPAPSIKPKTNILEKYQAAEAKVSEKLYGITGFSEAQAEKQRRGIIQTDYFLKERIKGSSEFLRRKGVPEWVVQMGEKTASLGRWTGSTIAGAVASVGQKGIDKPITTPLKYAALGTAGYGVGLGASGAAAIFGGTGGVAATGAFGGGTSALFVPTIKAGAAAFGIAFIGKKGFEAFTAPTPIKRGGVIGETIFEVGAIGGGYASGRKSAAKLGDLWRTKGRTEIPSEDIILPEVLSGEKRFVESYSYGYKGSPSGKAKQQFDIKVFEQKPYAYHVTPSQYWKGEFTTVKGTSEVPGLYTAPSPSIYFAKVTPGTPSYKLFGTGFEGTGKPAIARVYTGFTTKRGVDKAFVTGTKPEIEAVIAPGKTFGKVSGETFIKFKDRRIPIDVFKQTGGKGAVSTQPTTLASSSSSVYNIPSQSIYSPVSSSLSSLFRSYKPSVISFNGKSSFISSGSPSAISSYISSSRPPYKSVISSPSIIPSSSVGKPSPSISSIINSLSSQPSGSSISSKTGRRRRKAPMIFIPSYSVRGSERGVSYVPQVLSKGRWLSVSSKTMTRTGALDRAFNVADNTTSRRVKIKKVNIAPQDKSAGMLLFRKHKFRPYKIRQGLKYKLPGSYIEKTSYAIDSVGEKRQLSAAAYAKKQGWLVTTKPKRKKSKATSKKKRRKSPWLF